MLNRESNYIIAREKKIVLWEGMSLLAMNSLYEKNGQYDGYLWSKHKRLTPCATRTIIFQRQFKLFNSLYHSMYLVFSTLLFSIANMFSRALSVEKNVTKHRNK